MRKADVVIGEIYEAKVSGRLVPVRVVKESLYGGYDGLNLKTGRRVRLRTAARLRRSLAETSGAEVEAVLSEYWDLADVRRRWDGEKYRLSAETESGALDEIVDELNDGELPAGWRAEWTGDEMDLVVERVDN